MKKILCLCLFLFVIFISGCKESPIDEETETPSPCRDNPLSSECFALRDLDLIERTPEDEYEIDEDFESDYLDCSPLSWLLFRNDMYEITSVAAVVKKDNNDNQYVSLFSDGKKGPLYHPMDRSLLFTRPFNLDYSKGGYAQADVFIPNENNNDFYFEVTAGAVSVIGIRVNRNGNVSVVTGGQFHFYEVYPPVYTTNVTLTKNEWHQLKVSWNVETGLIGAYLVNDEDIITLYSGSYHRSTRYSAKVDGEPIPPNNVRFSTPKLITSVGYFYIDNVIVRRVEN